MPLKQRPTLISPVVHISLHYAWPLGHLPPPSAWELLRVDTLFVFPCPPRPGPKSPCDTTVPSSGAGFPPVLPRECLSPLPKVSRRHLQNSPPPLSHSASPDLAPHLCLSPWPHSFPLLPLPPFIHTEYLFSESQKPSQTSDIYSLELEYFLFHFPRARPLGEISPSSRLLF